MQLLFSLQIRGRRSNQTVWMIALSSLVFAIFGLAALHPLSARADIVYAVEDGTSIAGDIGFGSAPTPPNMCILINRFATVPGFETVSAVQVAWGGGSFGNGHPAFVAVWSDSDGDGNPADAVLLSSAPVITQSAGTGTFVEYAIPPVTVHGSFFAGVAFTNTDFVFVGRATPTVPLGRSWSSISTLGDIHSAANLDSLTTAHLMIRTLGTADITTKPQWQTVNIPALPTGSRLGSVWARTRNEAYVWACLTNSPQSFLFKWDGISWRQVLSLPNHAPGKIYGTGSSDVFISTDYHTNASNGSSFARVYRSTDNGTNWTLQFLPSVLTNSPLNFGYFGGTPNNVQFHSGTADAYIVRFDGTDWNLVFNNFDIYGLTIVGPNEGYYVTCNGWGNWNGTTWQSHSGSIGCDVYGGVWGTRDAAGKLSLYATGQENNNNGPHIWRFDETNSTWSQVFSDNPAPDGKGNGIAIWGSAPDDVYVVGDLISGQTDTGRVYHFDGTAWSQITNIGATARPEGIAGTAADDVWISLGKAGALLHLAPSSPPVLAISLISTNVVISWSGSAVGYRLESATSLTLPVVWNPVTDIPSLMNNVYRVTLPATNLSRYFRLRVL
jgi:hypothetical protein